MSEDLKQAINEIANALSELSVPMKVHQHLSKRLQLIVETIETLSKPKPEAIKEEDDS